MTTGLSSNDVELSSKDTGVAAPVAELPAATKARRRTPRRPAAVVLRAPFTARTGTEALYVLIGLPIALVEFVLVVGFVFGTVWLAVTLVGLPLVALGLLGARRLGAFHRWLAQALLGERVPPPRPFRSGPGFFGWLQAALRDGASWRAFAYLVIDLPVAFMAFYVSVAVWVGGLFCLTYPLWWRLSPRPAHGLMSNSGFIDGLALIGRAAPTSGSHVAAHTVSLRIGGLYLDTWPRALLVSLGGIVAVLGAPWVVRAFIWLQRQVIGGLLGPSRGSERVDELEHARAQIIDDSAARLRRIERDLHDGTQAQLATLAMNLGQAKEKLEPGSSTTFDPAGAFELVQAAHGHAKEALIELRDIARGIHPPALDLGLDAALTTLVARSAVPAVLNIDLATRPAEAIETIAYFSVAELLANVAKHSGARHATVEVIARDDRLRLEVTDDGTGGARTGAGSGLSGLSARVRAVDGHLRVSSPRGGPTAVVVELPLHT